MCIIKPMRSLFILYCTVVDLTGLFLTCVGSILLGVLYQVVKCLRQYAHRRYRVKERYVNVYNQTQNSYMCTCRLLPSQRDVRPCILSDPKIVSCVQVVCYRVNRCMLRYRETHNQFYSRQST